MDSTQSEPVIEGWFTETDDGPRLIGTQCSECGTYYFPKQSLSCRNPECASDSFDEVELSNTGRIWSFTSASYAPPPPYVSDDDFEPFIMAAVELQREKMVILGQMVSGTRIEDLAAGQAVSLAIEELYVEDGVSRTSWKWKLD